MWTIHNFHYSLADIMLQTAAIMAGLWLGKVCSNWIENFLRNK